ncbi:MAG: hypothetical protein ABSG18_21365 [Steroidobacteraceae bacterium]
MMTVVNFSGDGRGKLEKIGEEAERIFAAALRKRSYKGRKVILVHVVSVVARQPAILIPKLQKSASNEQRRIALLAFC